MRRMDSGNVIFVGVMFFGFHFYLRALIARDG
jgi:hypothetical protein